MLRVQNHSRSTLACSRGNNALAQQCIGPCGDVVCHFVTREHFHIPLIFVDVLYSNGNRTIFCETTTLQSPDKTCAHPAEMSVEAFGNGSRGSRSRAGTPSRRRLSGRMVLTPLGSNAVGNNDRAEKMNRRRREARRRSGRFTPIASGMGARSQNVTDEDITAQVSQTIKLHVENKISEKNAFSLPLGGMLKSTNTKFERASMILEAGTMIYGKRVDSTLVDSLKVRENLLRTKTAEADKPKGVIKTNVSKKVCVTSTIEKNLANITETKRNQAFAVDPLFRQMSMKFDNGGAQGMLLNSLPVKQGCFVAFDSSQALFSQPTVEEEQVGDVEDQSQITVPAALLGGFRQAVARMGSIPTCSALLDVLYNEAAADEPFKQSGNDTVIQSTAQVEAEMSTRNFEPTDWDTTDTGADVDCDGDYDDFDGGDDDEYLNHLASGPATEGAESSPAFDFWSSDYSSSTFSAGRRVVDIEVAIRESGLNDYTFFDSKFNRRAAASKKSKKSTAQTDGRKQKKSKFFFDFLSAVKKASETTPEDVVHVFAAPDNPKKLQLSSRAVTAKVRNHMEHAFVSITSVTCLFVHV